MTDIEKVKRYLESRKALATETEKEMWADSPHTRDSGLLPTPFQKYFYNKYRSLFCQEILDLINNPDLWDEEGRNGHD